MFYLALISAQPQMHAASNNLLPDAQLEFSCLAAISDTYNKLFWLRMWFKQFGFNDIHFLSIHYVSYRIYLTCSITSLCIFSASFSALLLLAWLGALSPEVDEVMAETPEKADESLLPELLRLPRLRLACFPLLLPLNLTLPLRLRLLQYDMKKSYQIQ